MKNLKYMKSSKCNHFSIKESLTNVSKLLVMISLLLFANYLRLMNNVNNILAVFFTVSMIIYLIEMINDDDYDYDENI